MPDALHFRKGLSGDALVADRVLIEPTPEYPNEELKVLVAKDWLQSVARMTYPGIDYAFAAGMRSAVENMPRSDLWEGPTNLVPVPQSVVQMEIVSSSNEDRPSGSGVHSIKVVVIGANGSESIIDLVLNGTTPVAIGQPVRFVNDWFSTSVGSSGQSVGAVTIRKTTGPDPREVYSYTAAGVNRGLSIMNMVPAGKRLYVTSFTPSIRRTDPNVPCSARFVLRTTSWRGIATSAFIGISAMYLDQSAFNRIFEIPIRIEPLSLVTVSIGSVLGNGTAYATWSGWLETIEG